MNREEQGQTPTLEESFAEIETIIEQLEGSEVTLDQSFQLYQKGVKQLKHCNELLDTVEKKLLMLNEDGELQEL